MNKHFPHIALGILLITCLAFVWAQTRIAGGDDFLMGATITSIDGTDTIKDSRAVINTNFANLNADKIELTDLSSTATGLTYTNTTGVFSLSAGYAIPQSTSISNWDTAYGWGDHSSAGYLTSLAQLGQIGDVSTSSLAAGYVLKYSGSGWESVATSTLGISGGGIETESDPIWTAASSSYLTTTTAGSTYLPLAGGVITNTLDLKDSSGDSPVLRLYESTGANKLQLYYENGFGSKISTNNKMQILSASDLVLITSNDTDDYITIKTASDVPNIHATGANLKITADGGTVDFDNENLTTTGNITANNIGIGTTTPAVALDVNGIIKTQPASSRTCNALAQGGIMYDSDDNHFYGCNGSNWVQLDN